MNTTAQSIQAGSAVEMLSKGRPKSIVAIDFKLANGLTVVPEVPTPTAFEFQLSNSNLHEPAKARPISSYTEIESLSAQDYDEEDEVEEEIYDDEYDEEEEYIEHGNDEDYYYPSKEEQDEYEVEYGVTYEQQVRLFDDIRRSFIEEKDKRQSQDTVSTWDEIQTPISLRRPMFPDVRLSKSVEGPVGPHLFRFSTASSELSFDQALQMSPIVLTKPKEQFYTVDPGRFYNIDDALQVDTPVTTISETAYRLPHLGKSWQTADPRNWTTQQVTVWMEDSGVESEMIDLFVENDMAGAVLWDLQFQDLKDLGIQSFGKRHQIWNLITALRDQFEEVRAHDPVEEKRGSRSSSRSIRRDAGRQSDESCSDGSPPIGHGSRRRRKVRRNGYEPVTPADSVSIVAIEQLLPKPHVCKRGDKCEKAKKQRRMLERLEAEKAAFPISPGAGGRIYMIGNPGNAATANRLLDNVRRANFERSAAREQHENTFRPLSESEPSLVGPSVVASSDLLGPGELPDFSLDPERLRLMGQRDPQDNVMQFLTLQHADPPSTYPSPFEGDMSQRSTPQPEMRLPEHTPPPLMNLQSLPKLQIPTAPAIPFHNSAGGHLAPAANDSILSPFSPCRTATATPVGANLYRFGTPASEMDVPVTQVALGPVARETSQSVPPDMHFRDPVQRSSSRPNDWRRPSFQLPVVAEETAVYHHQQQPAVRRTSSDMPRNSSPDVGEQSSTRSASPRSMLSSHVDGVTNAAASSVTSISQYDQRYPHVMHSGWMKKRKTRLLRHEWNEHHFRLTDKAQLTMHKNDMTESSPLESLNIDDYSVACSSLASNKLSARLKALRVQNDKANKDTATQAKDAAFSFQLVPGSKKGSAEKKTHHFAVKTRDQKLDWMRELMLAKAQREREGNGYEVEVNRVRKSEEVLGSK